MGGPGEPPEEGPAVVKANVDGPQAESLGADSRSGLATFDHHRSPKVSRALFGELPGW